MHTFSEPCIDNNLTHDWEIWTIDHRRAPNKMQLHCEICGAKQWFKIEPRMKGI